MICWTHVLITKLWPYAIKIAIDVGNNCPDESVLTALERFLLTKGHDRVKKIILNPKLCQKKLIQKRTP